MTDNRQEPTTTRVGPNQSKNQSQPEKTQINNINMIDIRTYFIMIDLIKIPNAMMADPIQATKMDPSKQSRRDNI